MFCPKVVLSCLLKEFGTCDITRASSRKEQKIIDSFAYILREASYDNLVIDCEEDACVEEDDTDPIGTGEDEESLSVRCKGTVRFGNVELTEEKVKEVLAFYRSTSKGFRKTESLRKRYRFISNEYHLKKLRQIERERHVHADRLVRLRMLLEKLKEEVLLKMNLGVSLHDNDIRQVALNINRGEELLIENFKASHRWTQNFKRSCGIVSRRITTFISKKNFLNQDRVLSEAQNFVSELRKGWPMEKVCDADQSGFLKELHSARSLAMRGSKNFQRVVQSVAGTTHSFIVLPTLFADGHLGEKLFVVTQVRETQI
ncbi:hypothetical protein Aduo_002558 [Ancylostoma duodenale]